MKCRAVRQSGGVSIFLVIFTALLITIAATGFVQIMVKGQQASTNADLSQSAYDSALAGVEDAKRALVKLERCRASGDTTCVSQMTSALNSNSCAMLSAAAVGVASNALNGGEEPVGNPAQNQAYTCVKVQLDSDSVVGDLSKDGEVKVVELRGTARFSKVRISWYTQVDAGAGNTPTFFDTLNGNSSGSSLPQTTAQWGVHTPPIMRAQLLRLQNAPQSLDTLDGLTATKFLYPFQGVDDAVILNQTRDFATDDRHTDRTHKNSPAIVQCFDTFSKREYLCSVTIDLPQAVDPSDSPNYLVLTSIYNNAHYKVELIHNSGGSDNIVKFDSVQPIVDSTGRAGDLFRRVRANVSVGGLPQPFPNAALNVLGNLCKDFSITNDTADYAAGIDGDICEP